jgi:hypothetical protein
MTVVLEPYAKLEGRVVTHEGNPVPREHVMARVHEEGRFVPNVPTRQMALTDDDGRFSVTAPAGTVALHLRDLQSAAVAVVDAPAGEVIDVGTLRVGGEHP